MIRTEGYKVIPATIVHRLTGKITSEDVESGIEEAANTFHVMDDRHGKLNLIVDTRGLLFADLKAHETWSRWLKTNSTMKRKVNFVVIVTDDSPNARAEKEGMETEKMKFFLDFDEGVSWLRNKLAV